MIFTRTAFERAVRASVLAILIGSMIAPGTAVAEPESAVETARPTDGSCVAEAPDVEAQVVLDEVEEQRVIRRQRD